MDIIEKFLNLIKYLLIPLLFAGLWCFYIPQKIEEGKVNSKNNEAAAMSIQDIIGLNVFQSQKEWKVIELLNNGNVAVLMQHEPSIEQKPIPNLIKEKYLDKKILIKQNGILAINNIDAQVNDIVKIKVYSSLNKNYWYEIESVVP